MATSRVTCQPRTTSNAARYPPRASEPHPAAPRPSQEYVKANGLKVAILFEGRDAAGKGGVISRITSAMSPRVCRVCALGVPTQEERSQWYFQVCGPVQSRAPSRTGLPVLPSACNHCERIMWNTAASAATRSPRGARDGDAGCSGT